MEAGGGGGLCNGRVGRRALRRLRDLHLLSQHLLEIEAAVAQPS